VFASLEDLRAEIDRIDRKIVALIGKRHECVKEAARFKKSERDVAAPDRVTAMLAARRQWAEQAAIDPDLIEKLYRDMLAYFIAQETEQWRSQHS